MKFGRNLPRNQVPEWSSAYINYKGLKKLIKSAELSYKTKGTADLAEFFFSLDRNLETVDGFYNKKFAESSRRLRILYDRYGSIPSFPDGIDAQEMDELMAALLDMRGQFRNLQWYGEVNKRGFVKITKKLDKKVPDLCAQTRYITSRVDMKRFATNVELARLMKNINEWISLLGEAQTIEIDRQSSASTDSKHYAAHLSPAITLKLDVCFKEDDFSELKGVIPEILGSFEKSDRGHVESNPLLLNLLQRAITCRAARCLPVLLSHITTLEEENDIYGRNCIHRLVIAIGRANSTGDEEMSSEVVLHSPTDVSNFIIPATTPIMQSAHSRSSHQSQLLGENDPMVNILKILLDKLLPHQREAIVARDSYGRTPLHYAAQNGFVVICTSLISSMRAWSLFDIAGGIDGAGWLDNEGWSPLHLSVLGGHPLTTRTLLEAGHVYDHNDAMLQNSSEKSKLGEVLALAVKANFISIVQLLVEFQADISFQDKDGETALHIAARFGRAQCAEMLLEECHDLKLKEKVINIQEKTFDWTALSVAAVDGQLEMVEILIKHGADAQKKDLSGWTAVEHAALRGHISIAKFIAEHSANTSKTDEESTESAQLSTSTSSNASLEERTSLGRTGNHSQKATEPIKEFGHRYLRNESMVLVSLGSRDMRKNLEPVKLDRIPIANAHSTKLDTALSIVVSVSGTQIEPTVIDLPVHDNIVTEPIVFNAKDPAEIRLLFDIVPTYAGSKDNIVGRGVALLGTVKQSIGMKRINLQGDLSVPIIAADTLDVIGSVNFNFLVITPFEHPKMAISEKKTYWKSLASTMVIGHRGLGKNQISRKSLQLGENTIQSFVAAANLGANYIEFDVQLTKDHVPVIYHDFLVSETGIDAPVHTLTLEQFLHVGEASTPKPSRGHSPSRAADPRLEGLKDFSRRTRSLSLDQGHNENGVDMSERMKHTRDFKIKGFKGNLRGTFIKDQFATLDQMFQRVPTGTGFNIEMKYPMLHESEEQEMDTYAIDLNFFVDTVLSRVFDHNVGPQTRDVIFSSFNPDICLLLSFKQPSIPVLFLTDAGTSKVGDIRASSLQEAIRFACRWNLLGVVTAAEPVVVAPRLIKVVKESGLVCVSYGVLNNDPINVQRQADQEIDAVIVDSLVTVREGLRQKAATSSNALPKVNGANTSDKHHTNDQASSVQSSNVDNIAASPVTLRTLRT